MRAATRQSRLRISASCARPTRPQAIHPSTRFQRRCVGVNPGAAGPGGGEGHPEPGMCGFLRSYCCICYLSACSLPLAKAGCDAVPGLVYCLKVMTYNLGLK